MATTYTVEDCCAVPVQPSIPPGTTGPPGPEGPQGPPGPPGECDCEDVCEWCCPLFCGTGSPEGVVTSPVGGVYEQTDAALTTHSIWIKREGVGNTGWRAWNGLSGAPSNSFEIGDNSKVWKPGCIAFGLGAEAGGDPSWDTPGHDTEDAIAIGVGARAAVASEFNNWSPDSIAIGARAFGIGWAAIAIGADASSGIDTADQESISIGRSAKVTREFTNLGEQGLIAIGAESEATGASSITIGYQSWTREDDTNAYTLVGAESTGVGDCNVAVGFDTMIRGNGCIAIGTHAGCLGKGSSIGVHAAVGGESDAVGSFAWINGADGAMALGPRSRVEAEADHAVSIGHSATVHNRGGIALGANAVTNKNYQLMIGGLFNGFGGISGIYFNGSGGTAFGAGSPAILVNPDGSIEIVKGTAGFHAAKKTADYEVVSGDLNQGIYIDASAGNITITMISYPSSGAWGVWFRRIDTSVNTVTIVGHPAQGSSTEFYAVENFGTYFPSWSMAPGSVAYLQRTPVTGHPILWRVTYSEQ